MVPAMYWLARWIAFVKWTLNPLIYIWVERKMAMVLVLGTANMTQKQYNESYTPAEEGVFAYPLLT